MTPRKKANATVESPVPFILLGMMLGYFLSKARLTDYDAILDLFLFSKASLPLWGTLAVALAVVAGGYWWMRLKGIRSRSGDPLRVEEPSFEWNRLPGGLLFGAGWALTGACPGTALAQLGEGKFVVLFTLLGALLGTWLYMKFMEDAGPDCD